MRGQFVVAFVGAVLLSGCGGSPTGTTPDDELGAALTAVSESGEETPLASLTDFAWDTVYVFGEAVSAEDVEAAVGVPVLEGEFFTEEGDLLVFTLDGEAQRASVVRFGPIVTDATTTSFTPEVVLRPREPGGLLDLDEP